MLSVYGVDGKCRDMVYGSQPEVEGEWWLKEELRTPRQRIDETGDTGRVEFLIRDPSICSNESSGYENEAAGVRGG